MGPSQTGVERKRPAPAATRLHGNSVCEQAQRIKTATINDATSGIMIDAEVDYINLLFTTVYGYQ
jgi:hypothetical protein